MQQNAFNLVIAVDVKAICEDLNCSAYSIHRDENNKIRAEVVKIVSKKYECQYEEFASEIRDEVLKVDVNKNLSSRQLEDMMEKTVDVRVHSALNATVIREGELREKLEQLNEKLLVIGCARFIYGHVQAESTTRPTVTTPSPPIPPTPPRKPAVKGYVSKTAYDFNNTQTFEYTLVLPVNFMEDHHKRTEQLNIYNDMNASLLLVLVTAIANVRAICEAFSEYHAYSPNETDNNRTRQEVVDIVSEAATVTNVRAICEDYLRFHAYANTQIENDQKRQEIVNLVTEGKYACSYEEFASEIRDRLVTELKQNESISISFSELQELAEDILNERRRQLNSTVIEKQV
ncbi:unnamed protein product [Cylicocyclus nassatus]|uniref:Uncharacterized protein n=1 Tax=Cylicocyclus nassatus TaxID=53992 RepID=A0AA36GI88_CYLNA|nr:unnamed protein product [Cylicocyclus nassatus]